MLFRSGSPHFWVHLGPARRYTVHLIPQGAAITVTAANLNIAPAWRDSLAEAGLDSLDSLLALGRGRLLSSHARGWVREVELAGGQVVYVKCALRTKLKQIASDLARFGRPQPLPEKERQGIRHVQSLGIAAPEVIAWGQRRRLGLPWQAALVMGPLAGQPIHQCLRALDPVARTEALDAAAQVVAQIRRAGLWWPGLRIKHIYLDTRGQIGRASCRERV